MSRSADESDDQFYINDKDETCGWQFGCTKISKRYSFPFLQRFATSKFALAFLCCAGVAQGFIVSGYFSVIVTTLEKRFHLHSTETGLIASSYDIASCIAVLFITYIGGKGHKPVWIGWGVFLLGLGTLLFAMPHFWAPPYTIGEEQHNLCNSTTLHNKCIPSTLRNYMSVFVIAQLLQGAGGTTLFTLGVTYLDANVAQVDSSLYHGIYFTSAVIGPALGFILGGQFLTVYTQIGESVDISDSSLLWVGAWWLGFLVGGLVIIVIAFPILLFPQQLPGTSHVRVDRESEMHQDRVAVEMSHSSSSAKFSDFGRSLLVLLRNPTFLLLTVAVSLDSSLVMGFTIFGPKYIESMFNITASQAAIYFGVLVILAGATGQFLGGYLVTKFKMTVSGILKFCAVCSACAFATSFVFLRSCPDTAFAGATVQYSTANEGSSLSAYDHTSPCNSACFCNPDAFDPVCGTDGITYYSPCFAGCLKKSDDVKYSNCSCVRPLNVTSVTSYGEVTSGKCASSKCSGLNLFLAVIFFTILFTFLAATPAIQVVLRVVPFTQRSFAIGVKFVFLRLLGSIPGPIVFGRVLDLACVVWSTECGKTGSCELYKNNDLAAHMTTLGASIKAGVTIFFLFAWLAYKPPAKGALERLDEISLGQQFSRNQIGLPAIHGGNDVIGDITKSRVTKFGKISYSTLREELSSSSDIY